jgi:hypothetical protein
MGKLENTVARVYHVSTKNDNKVKASARDRHVRPYLVPPRLALESEVSVWIGFESEVSVWIGCHERMNVWRWWWWALDEAIEKTGSQDTIYVGFKI